MRPQKFLFRSGELEQEIRREALDVALNLFVQSLRRNSIEDSEIRVEYDFMVAKNQDFRLYAFSEGICLAHNSAI